jgi:hypothetical protein
MTPFQIGALVLLALTAAWSYLPRFSLPVLPRKKPDSLQQIAQVIAIRESASDPKVKEACSLLLQALIG